MTLKRRYLPLRMRLFIVMRNDLDSEINPFSPPTSPARKPVKSVKLINWNKLNPLERVILVIGCVVGLGLFSAFMYWVTYEDPVDRQERIERNKWCNRNPNCPKFYGEPYPEK